MESQQAPRIWESLTPGQRKFTTASITAGIVQFVVTDVYFRVQQLSAINSYLSGATGEVPRDGITFLPLILSLAVFAVLVGSPVALVNSRARSGPRAELILGSAWVLASVALSFDYLIDTFEPKLAIAALFAFVGLRYWKGTTDSSLAFVLAPLVTLIAAGDGLGHLSGMFCSTSGLDACAAKAVSDSYLVIMLLPLTYFTVAWRENRPPLWLILATVIIPVAVVISLSAFP